MLTQTMKWRDAKKTKPRREGEYLIAMLGASGNTYVTNEFWRDGLWQVDSYPYVGPGPESVIAWMPMPKYEGMFKLKASSVQYGVMSPVVTDLPPNPRCSDCDKEIVGEPIPQTEGFAVCAKCYREVEDDLCAMEELDELPD